MRLLKRMLGDYSIRAAHAADAPQLADLCAEHAAFEQLSYSALGHVQRLAQALASQRLQAWLVSDAQAQPVGYASLTLDFGALCAQPFAHLDCLYLRPQARGQRLGQALMLVVQAFARAQGVSQMQWQTPAWNAPAVRFYQGMGASAVEKQRFTWVL